VLQVSMGDLCCKVYTQKGGSWAVPFRVNQGSSLVPAGDPFIRLTTGPFEPCGVSGPSAFRTYGAWAITSSCLELSHSERPR
jgi:hypothetical protein